MDLSLNKNKKTTDDPQTFFDDIENLFKTKEFQKLLDSHIYNNVDFDVFTKIFVMYFIVYIQSSEKNSVEEKVKELIKNKNSRQNILRLL